jgi:Protein of unknown function (DUF2939)
MRRLRALREAMRWTLRFAILFFLAWAIFMVSPFVALYSLAKSVQARDLAAIEERVNFRAVRLSLSKQIVSEYLRASGRGAQLEGMNRSLASSAGATLADPLVAKIASPEALLGWLDGRLPEPLARNPAARADLQGSWSGANAALRSFVFSETRGFRTVLVPIPGDRPPAEQFRLQVRLVGTTWRLIGVELPKSLVETLVRQLPRSTS